ncbi:hemopexin [Bombina bombina]|uniref:hemopexin n=1 Tax=Bombina bombina TaxID=8345 RepID=UPI00235B08E6|nr:hemopexin [Bombina bombina]
MVSMRGPFTAVILLCISSLVVSFPWFRKRTNATSSHQYPSKDLSYNVTGLPDRCSDEGFDSITIDDEGVMHFFRGDYVWSGFKGSAQLINETWRNLSRPVDAAFRNYNRNLPLEHERTYLFQGSKVWSYFEGHLLKDYPRNISQEFPGIPNDLDAAVECHEGECKVDSVIFFKGPTVYVYSPQEEPRVKQRTWTSLGQCSAAIRWLERYYCFNGINFTRFDPVSGERLSPIPLDTRDYFISCPGRGHGHAARQNATFMSIKSRCSSRPFEALSSDDKGRVYAFRGGWYFRLDTRKDGWHAWPLNHSWKNLQGVVDAAFSWENKIYFIQGSQVTIYLSDQVYTEVQGYPKSLQEELGVSEIDAAFTCPQSSELYVIKGNKIQMVDLSQSPRRQGPERPIVHDHVDSAMCGINGIDLFIGPFYYHYKNVEELVSAVGLPRPGNITANFFDC